VAQEFRTIGLLDHLGHGNLGDDATLTAVLSNIRSRCPDAEFVALCLNPFDTLHRHGITSYAIRRDSKIPPPPATSAAGSEQVSGTKGRLKARLAKYPRLLGMLRAVNDALVRRPKALIGEISFLLESFRIARRLDLLVICGGGQLLDSWGGAWSFPYTLLKWVALAKLAGVRCYFLNVGAGPLQSSLSRRFIRYALQLSDYTSFRDHKSQTLVQECGFRGPSEVLPDNVFALDLSAMPVENRQGEQRSVVAICPMIYCDPRVYWEKDQQVYDGFIGKLADLGASLIEQDRRLALFSSDIRIDLPAIADLHTALTRKTSRLSLDRRWIRPYRVQSTEELIATMSGVDFVVTCRFHGVVFAQLLNKPVMALSHHPKVATLMADFGMAEYCLDIRKSDAQLLKSTFARLIANQDEIRARMASKVAESRRLLAQQFDAVFSRQAHVREAAPSLLTTAGIGESGR